MARTTVPLTLDLLDALDAPCRTCLFWERPWEKDLWVSEVLREWGSCGRVVLVDDEPVGYVGYAPAAFVPAAARLPSAPVSADAVLLTTAWVAPSYAGGGLGRLLVQAMARDLVARPGVRAVEAFAHTPLGAGRSRCVLPADFLARVGFRTHRRHPVTPLMRMELRSLATWRDEVEAVWGRVRGVVRPRPLPAPASRSRPPMFPVKHVGDMLL